jgi:two-component system, NarL family, response regulator DegU
MSIRIVIADDHPLFRRGLVDTLSESPGIEIVGEASDGERAMALIEEHKPDVAVLDIDMPKASGLEVAKMIGKKKLGLGIIILSMHDERIIFENALKLGVMGYVLKESAVAEIVDCITAVSQGKPFVSPALSQHLMRSNKAASEGLSKKLGLSDLTAAEKKVLKLISEGKSTKQIADELFISPKTVGHHRSHICEKVGITGTNALLKFALEHKEIL